MNVYVETSVWNMRVDEEDINRQKRRVTKAFFAEADRGRREVSRYNGPAGLHVPEIATPEEVTEDVQNDGRSA